MVNQLEWQCLFTPESIESILPWLSKEVTRISQHVVCCFHLIQRAKIGDTRVGGLARQGYLFLQKPRMGKHLIHWSYLVSYDFVCSCIHETGRSNKFKLCPLSAWVSLSIRNLFHVFTSYNETLSLHHASEFTGSFSISCWWYIQVDSAFSRWSISVSTSRQKDSLSCFLTTNNKGSWYESSLLYLIHFFVVYKFVLSEKPTVTRRLLFLLFLLFYFKSTDSIVHSKTTYWKETKKRKKKNINKNKIMKARQNKKIRGNLYTCKAKESHLKSV